MDPVAMYFHRIVLLLRPAVLGGGVLHQLEEAADRLLRDLGAVAVADREPRGPEDRLRLDPAAADAPARSGQVLLARLLVQAIEELRVLLRERALALGEDPILGHRAL